MLTERVQLALKEINFVERYLKSRNSRAEKVQSDYFLVRKDLKEVFQELRYPFKVKGPIFSSDVVVNSQTYRILFDIKYDTILTYIYIIKDGQFVNNGLAHFGYMLNYFDLSKYELNQTFYLKDKDDLKDYINEMLDIFDDFIRATEKSPCILLDCSN